MKNDMKKYFIIFELTLVALLEASYALFSMVLVGQKKYVLESGVISGKNIYNYTFRMWINYEAGNEVCQYDTN